MAASSGPVDGDYLGDEQLTLAGDDERLPWLESGEDELDEPGVDSARIFGFALLALLALAAIVAAVWWFSHRAPDSEFAPDGSTIAAPEGPYKVRPTDPGGKEFEGTGDMAPAVGEGQTRDGRIADEPPAPAPSVDVPASSATPAASASAAAPQPTGGIAVQVGAYTSKDAAEQGWRKLQSQTEHLNGVSHRVVQGQADIGTVFRLQAIAGDVAGANSLCAALKGDGVACQVKR